MTKHEATTADRRAALTVLLAGALIISACTGSHQSGGDGVLVLHRNNQESPPSVDQGTAGDDAPWSSTGAGLAADGGSATEPDYEFDDGAPRADQIVFFEAQCFDLNALDVLPASSRLIAAGDGVSVCNDPIDPANIAASCGDPADPSTMAVWVLDEAMCRIEIFVPDCQADGAPRFGGERQNSDPLLAGESTPTTRLTVVIDRRDDGLAWARTELHAVSRDRMLCTWEGVAGGH